jgi:hypothetical protein
MPNVRWEQVNHNWTRTYGTSSYPAFKLLRAKVPGRWLVTIQEITVQTTHFTDILHSADMPGGLTFVPDPNYSWV